MTARTYLVAGSGPEHERLAERVRRAAHGGNLPPGRIDAIAPALAAQRIDEACRHGGASSMLLVPAPHVPQLFAEWLLASLPGCTHIDGASRLPQVAFARRLRGDVLASVAEWRCPPQCIEPEVCPATRQPKRWRIEEAITAQARVAHANTLIAHLVHVGGGVMAMEIREWVAERDRAQAALRAAPVPLEFVAATVSSCHAVATWIRAQDGAAG